MSAEAAKKAKQERDNIAFLLAALFRAASCTREVGLILGAGEAFDMAESQLKEAEARGISPLKIID